MDTQDNEAEVVRSAQKTLFIRTLEGAIACGEIDPRGKTAHEFVAEAAGWIAHWASSDGVFRMVTDNLDSILAEARRLRRRKSLDLACLLYAIWFEHIVNQIVDILVSRLDREELDAAQIIRETSFRARIGWVLCLMGGRPIPKEHMRTLSELMEARNSFAHYKWKAKDLDEYKALVARMTILVQKCEKAVRYMKRYQCRLVLRDSMALLREAAVIVDERLRRKEEEVRQG